MFLVDFTSDFWSVLTCSSARLYILEAWLTESMRTTVNNHLCVCQHLLRKHRQKKDNQQKQNEKYISKYNLNNRRTPLNLVNFSLQAQTAEKWSCWEMKVKRNKRLNLICFKALQQNVWACNCESEGWWGINIFLTMPSSYYTGTYSKHTRFITSCNRLSLQIMNCQARVTEREAAVRAAASEQHQSKQPVVTGS